MKAKIIAMFNKTIEDGIEDNELLLTRAYKNEVQNMTIDSETEYQLMEFREMQSSYFDDTGKAYKGIIISTDIAERMLKLINQLESAIN